MKFIRKKSIWIPLAALFAIYAGYHGLRLHLEKSAAELPLNSPGACANRPPAPGKKRVLLLGDSITHGRVSFNYVDRLEKNLGDKFEFVNAGVNGQLAFNIYQGLEAGLACKPDIVVLLAGCNDINALASEEKAMEYVRENKLPDQPSLEFYRKYVELILKRVSRVPEIQMAVISPGLIGEDLQSKANQHGAAHAGELKKIAESRDLTYLPLQESQRKFLAGKNTNKVACQGGENLVSLSVMRLFLLGHSFDKISRSQGFYLTTDCLHLNSVGAGMVSDLITEFLKGSE